MSRWNWSNWCSIGCSRSKSYRRHGRRRGRDTMKCAECIHCREILTFGHFVLLVFDDTHKGGKIRIHSHFSIRSRVGCVWCRTLYIGYCKKSISIFLQYIETTRIIISCGHEPQATRHCITYKNLIFLDRSARHYLHYRNSLLIYQNQNQNQNRNQKTSRHSQ